MGRTAIVAAIAALVGMPAFAADMAVKAPPSPPPAPVYQWAGFYIGGNVGGTWNDNSVNLVSHAVTGFPDGIGPGSFDGKFGGWSER